MAHRRTWLEKHRDVDTCAQFLIAYDSNSRQRRAERLSLETQVELPVEYRMPNWTSQMLDEAGECFMNGLYTGCILSLSAGIEHGLAELCPDQAGGRFEDLINAAFDRGYLYDYEKKALSDLKAYRNDMAHSNIDKLAVGKKLQIQKIVLTESGITEGVWSEEFVPRNQNERETAASLSAEKKTQDLYLRVRNVVYDIFDRNESESKESDDLS